ncbi:MAG: hypothetical protein WCG84_01905 [Candidatus Moraniibacteriota bacterium]
MSQQPIFEWQVHETETQAPSRKLLFWLGVALLGIIGYELFVNNPIVAITFILIGITGYILLHREARFLHCRIFPQGVGVNSELFPFDQMDHFWIFENEPGSSFVRFKTKTLIEPFVDIPLGDTDPQELRQILGSFIPEERIDLTLVDIFSRMLHI